MPLAGTITVRHPDRGEVPAELMQGFEAFQIDCQWQWVAEVDGQIVAQLLAAPMHGMLYLMRITAAKDAPASWAVSLFRRMLREGRERGLIGYVVVLSDATAVDRRLMRIVQRHNGFLEPITGVIACGHLENTY